MSFVGLKVPADTARLLSTIEVPGRREDPGFFHITLNYLGKEVPIASIARAMVAIYEVAQRTSPFSLNVSQVTCFDDHGDGVPIICQVESPELHALNDRLKASFDKHGVEYSKKWPVFKPHVTLSYADTKIVDIDVPTVTWGAHELILWGGDEADQRLSVTFPLTLSLAERVARRFRKAV